MKRTALFMTIAIALLSVSPCAKKRGGIVELTPEQIEKLARCVTEKGWVMYGTVGCSGCRAQRKGFGDSWPLINYVECDPHEAGAQPERCLERNIGKTPAWILEVDGAEVRRVESYQLLEDLARETGCAAEIDGLEELLAEPELEAE